MPAKVDSSVAEGDKSEHVTEKDIDFVIPDPLMEQQWSCVPIMCTLAEGESLDGRPKRCQFIVPRQSYLFHYTYTQTITSALCNFARGSGCRWFSYRSMIFPKSEVYLPLPIQYPVHVLCDMIASERASSAIPAFRAPLQVRLHFTEPKKEEFEAMCRAVPSVQQNLLPTWDGFQQRYQAVLRLDNARSGYKWHRHILKQSLVAKFGTSQALQVVERDLPKHGSELIQSVVFNQCASFWRAKCCIEQCGEMRTTNDEHHLIVIHHGLSHTQLVVCKNSTQKLGLFLKEHVTAFGALGRDQVHTNQPCHAVFVQGLNPLLSTPLDALFDLFGACDLAVHIVLKNDLVIGQYLRNEL